MVIDFNDAAPQEITMRPRLQSSLNALRTETYDIEEFRQHIESHGLLPLEIVGDGALHRCPTADKPHGKDGAYILHLDGRVSGWWQNWRTGEFNTWTAENQHEMSPAERKAFQKRIEADKRKRHDEQTKRYEEAAVKAQSMIQSLPKATADTPYLRLKGVNPAGDLRTTKDGTLVVPVLGADGKKQSIQFISPDGKEKRPIAGSKMGGGYFPITGTNDGHVFITEGVATVLSVYESEGTTAFSAFNAGNLMAVAKMAREQYPDREIVIAADNDLGTERRTGKNPGREKAEEAAAAIGGKVAIPLFMDREDLSDFNDLHQLKGLEAVRERLARAYRPSSASTGADDDPRPLRRDLGPAIEFPLEALGPILGDAATAIHEIVQAPVGICANSVLGAAALAVQGRATIEIDGRHYPPSLFLVTVAGSGERKSEADRVALKFVRDYEEALAEEHSQKLADYHDEKEAWDKSRSFALGGSKKTKQDRLNALKEIGPEPDAPLVPFIICEEPTFGGLCRLFQVGLPSLGIFSDEGGRLVGGHSMRDENRLEMATGLSSLWGGQTLKRIRVGDGASSLGGRRLSIHLLMQEKVSMQFLGDEVLRDQGLVARCLVSFPESAIGRRPYQSADAFQDARISKYLSTMAGLIRAPLPFKEGSRQELDPPMLRPDSEAKSLWLQFYEHVEQESGPEGELCMVPSFASKAPEHALRLSAVVALANAPEATTIDMEAMRCGIELAGYYLAEALRITDAAAVPPEIAQAETLLKWLQETWKPMSGEIIPLSAIYQRGPSSLRTAADAKKAMKVLGEHGWCEGPEPREIDGKNVRETWRIR